MLNTVRVFSCRATRVQKIPHMSQTVYTASKNHSFHRISLTKKKLLSLSSENLHLRCCLIKPFKPSGYYLPTTKLNTRNFRDLLT